MSQLQEYLNKYFNSAFTLDEIKEKFITEFGVNVNTHNGLYQFKYDQLQAKFVRPLTAECRGAILYQSQSGWKYVARPFNKFFNQHEGFCPIFNEADFNLIKNQLAIYEKVDGSCIILYHNPITNNWQASTLGSIPTGNVGDYKFSFSELFFKTIGLSNTQLANFLDTNYTYIFELACNENRIVTKYPQNQVVLLAVRHNEYGTYVDPLDDIVINLLSNGASNLRLPWKKMLYELDIITLDDLRYWVNTKGIEAIEQDGVEYSEGFVVYQGNKPIAKIKSNRYVSLHSVGGGDIKHTRNVVIDSFFNHTLDDIFPVLVDTMKEFAKSLETKVANLLTQSQQAEATLRELQPSTQKDYAMAVQKHAPKIFWSYFFQYKDDILKNNDPERFNKWICLNYQKFDWKD
jgi:hypothetical protein